MRGYPFFYLKNIFKKRNLSKRIAYTYENSDKTMKFYLKIQYNGSKY